MVNNVRFGLVFKPVWLSPKSQVVDEALIKREIPVDRIQEFHSMVSSLLTDRDMTTYAAWRPVVALITDRDNQFNPRLRGFTGEDARFVIKHFPMVRVERKNGSGEKPVEVFDLRQVKGVRGQKIRRQMRDYLEDRENSTIPLPLRLNVKA